MYVGLNSGNNGPYTDSVNTQAFFLTTRVDNTSIYVQRNGSTIRTVSAAASASATNTVCILAWGESADVSGNPHPGFYSTRECAGASIGTGLTTAEGTIYYNIWQRFNTKLGRNI
jgi:hypothetical protein